MASVVSLAQALGTHTTFAKNAPRLDAPSLLSRIMVTFKLYRVGEPEHVNIRAESIKSGMLVRGKDLPVGADSIAT